MIVLNKIDKDPLNYICIFIICQMWILYSKNIVSQEYDIGALFLLFVLYIIVIFIYIVHGIFLFRYFIVKYKDLKILNKDISDKNHYSINLILYDIALSSTRKNFSQKVLNECSEFLDLSLLNCKTKKYFYHNQYIHKNLVTIKNKNESYHLISYLGEINFNKIQYKHFLRNIEFFPSIEALYLYNTIRKIKIIARKINCLALDIVIENYSYLYRKEIKNKKKVILHISSS